MKKKILIIPSWYPTHSNPVLGCFFREQALIMSNDYDVKVLVSNEINSMKRYIVRSLLHPIIKDKIDYRLNESHVNPPDVISFNYIISLRYFSH